MMAGDARRLQSPGKTGTLGCCFTLSQKQWTHTGGYALDFLYELAILPSLLVETAYYVGEFVDLQPVENVKRGTTVDTLGTVRGKPKFVPRIVD